MIPIEKVSKFYFSFFEHSKNEEKIIDFLKKGERAFKRIPVNKEKAVFEILVGIRGSGKTTRITRNKKHYSDYLIIDPDLFRKYFKDKESPSIIKDILVLYGISNGMNVILQSGKWSNKREFFLFLSKNREKILKNLMINSTLKYINKVTIFSTNPAIARFSAGYRYFIENKKYYVYPYSKDNYIEKGLKSIYDFLTKVKRGNHIRTYITDNNYKFQINKIPLKTQINSISFVDRKSFIRLFDLKRDESLINELFPYFYKATLYREMNLEDILNEYKKITKAISFAKKHNNKEFLTDSLLYLSYMGYSLFNYIKEYKILDEREKDELEKIINVLKNDINFHLFEKVRVENTNLKKMIESFLENNIELRNIDAKNRS